MLKSLLRNLSVFCLIALIANVHAICNECNGNGVACISKNQFVNCVDGKPDPRTNFTCPEPDQICTNRNKICFDEGQVPPACGDTSNCGRCDNRGDFAFACTSRTSFVMCFNGEPTNSKGSCPEKHVCQVKTPETDLDPPCIPDCYVNVDELCDLRGPTPEGGETTTATPSTGEGDSTPSTEEESTPSTEEESTPSTEEESTPSTEEESTPSTEVEEESTPSTEEEESTQSTEEGHSTPSTEEGDESTLSTAGGHSTPSTEEEESTPSTEEEDESTLSTAGGHSTPSTEEGESTPSTENGESSTTSPSKPSEEVCKTHIATGRYPHPTDTSCERYIYCFRQGGKLVGRDLRCPEGSYYNKNTRNCQRQRPANCTPN